MIHQGLQARHLQFYPRNILLRTVQGKLTELAGTWDSTFFSTTACSCKVFGYFVLDFFGFCLLGFLFQIARSLRSDTELHKSMFWTILIKPTSAVQNGNVRLQDELGKTTSLVSF